MTRFIDLLQRFRKDERGVFAVLFGLLAIVLIATSGAVVDFTSMEQARTRAQTALDSAALALQGDIDTLSEEQLKAKAQAILVERLNDSTITTVVDSATKDTSQGTLNLDAHIIVPTSFVQLVGIPSITAGLESEVTRASSDIEVALALDVTGSMAATYDRYGNKTSDKIGDLITATRDLIEKVVKVDQTPTYSRMAIVPWSFGANVGSYAASVRGTPTAGVTISSVTWKSTTIPNISKITKASPGVITIASATGLANDDWVYISGVSGMTQINGKIGQIANLNVTAKTFNLKISGSNLSTSGYSTATNNTGTVTKCLVANCEEVVTTAGNHGLNTNDYAFITGTVGMTGFNNCYTPNETSNCPLSWKVTKLTATTYSATSSSPSNGIRTSGGTAYCAQYGCPYYYFQNASGSYNTYLPSNCTTERSTHSYDDTAPSTTKLAFNYTSGGSACVSQQIQPLTSNRTTLDNLAKSLTATGSTSGHLGLAWGWYMISPNFAYLWPNAENKPAAYNTTNLVKAIVFMTDGDFNSPYCNGVIAKNAGSGSGDATTHNSCDAPLGTSKAQAQQLCDAIKSSTSNYNILLYVVGFDLAGNTDALNFLEGCASPGLFFQADDGTDLSEAFKKIADSLSDLHLSK